MANSEDGVQIFIICERVCYLFDILGVVFILEQNIPFGTLWWFKTPQPEFCVELASMIISLQH